MSNRLPELAARIAAAHVGVEAAASRAAEHAIEAGTALLEAKGLLKQGEWLPWLRQNCGISERSAQLYMRIVRGGMKSATVADIGLQAAAAAVKAIDAADINLLFAESDAAAQLAMLREIDVAKNHRAQGTGDNEWYTPSEYIEAARDVMGTIDLDPASSDQANETVQATTYFTEADDGLTKDWRGKVWLNPPYSQPSMMQFVEKLVKEYEGKSVTEAIMVTHNYTETRWYQKADLASSASCFVDKRISFISPTGEVAAPTQGQVFHYFGANSQNFGNVFKRFGRIHYTAAPSETSSNALVFQSDADIYRYIKERRESDAADRRAANDAIRLSTPLRTDGKFETIVIDPPWDMEKIERDVAPNQVGFDYPTMTEEQLAAFDVAGMAADDCHLFCWTTQKHRKAAERLVEAWGFKEILLMVWHKPGGFQPYGLPQYNGEFVIYARRGNPVFIDLKTFPCVFHGERREHSRKPDEFYDMIKRVTGGTRIDVFSREKRDGFEQFGNEADKFSVAEIAA